MKQPTPARMEAFSDGVIAVIITIMVLDLHVPRADGLPGLLAVLPTVAIYLMSFLFTGIYWVNHHHLVDRVKTVTPSILWANLGLLFALSLLPFFTAYLIEKHFNPLSVQFYAGALVFAAMTFQNLSRVIGTHLRRTGMLEDLGQHMAEAWKGRISFGMYLTGMLLAARHPYFALSLLASVTLIWIVPTFGTRKPAECAAAAIQSGSPQHS